MRGGFSDGEDVACGQRGGGVVGGLGLRRDDDRGAAEVACDPARDADGARRAFDGADCAFQIGRGAAREGLQRVQRAGGGAESFERGEDGAVEGAVGVEDGFAR